jgi:3',5'-cyclic AMP phosphodiesterase CpdA
MKMETSYSRRRFLGTMAAGGALLAMGLPQVGGCPSFGPRRGRLRLVFYTDVHARTEWDTPLALERAADAINQRRPDLVFAGGDLITEGFESSAELVAPRWDAYMAMHRQIDRDVHPALGNHDLVAAIPKPKYGIPPSPDPRATFRAKFGLDPTYYSLDAAGYHCLVLDSIEVTGGELKYRGFIPPEQIEWLKQDLSRLSMDTPIVMVLHLPLLTALFAATEGSTVPAKSNRVVVNNSEVLELFRDRNLVLVLQGHLHVSELLRWRGTTFITGGAVSGKWWRGAWHGTEPGFCVVTLRGDRVEWEYVEYGWEARRPRFV